MIAYQVDRTIFIAATWFVAGLMTYLMDKARTKNTDEMPFPFWRAIWAGYVGFLLTLGLCIFPPVTIKEDEPIKKINRSVQRKKRIQRIDSVRKRTYLRS